MRMIFGPWSNFMSTAAQQRYTVDQYHQRLLASEQRLEYYYGEIFAMPGGTPAHAQISTNLVGTLHLKLRGKPCRVLNGDQSIKLHDSMYSFADALIVCGESRYEQRLVTSLTNPKVIVEVLSPSTESYDRGIKFENYENIVSLTDYLLVSHDQARIEHWQRDEFGEWGLTTVAGLESVVELGRIARLPLAEVYERVEFSDAPVSQKFPISNDKLQ